MGALLSSDANSPTVRAGVYARYSSDDQREASIDDQIRICRAEIERHGWKFVQVYADPAISGASTFAPLLDASTGTIDVVVAESLTGCPETWPRVGFESVRLIKGKLTVREDTLLLCLVPPLRWIDDAIPRLRGAVVTGTSPTTTTAPALLRD